MIDGVGLFVGALTLSWVNEEANMVSSNTKKEGVWRVHPLGILEKEGKDRRIRLRMDTKVPNTSRTAGLV